MVTITNALLSWSHQKYQCQNINLLVSITGFYTFVGQFNQYTLHVYSFRRIYGYFL